MFTFLLYLRILLTVVLVGLVIFAIIRRFRARTQRKEALKKQLHDDESEMQDSDEYTEHIDGDESLLYDNVDKVKGKDNPSIISENTSDSVENLSYVGMATVVHDYIENENGEIVGEIIQEEIDIVVEAPDSPEETSTEEEDNDAVEIEKDKELEEAIIEDTVVAETPKYIEKSTKTVSMSQGNTQDIETPKNIDGGVDLSQGHSRDDIVRDKFEKHMQKIRYDAGILKQRNDLLGYEKKLVEGLTMLPTDKDFQKQLADLYFHQGKFIKAHSLLKKILVSDPEDHNALWQVGEISVESGHADDAYVYFTKAYELCNDNPKYCFSLAQRYYDHQDLEKALPLLEKIVKLRPKNIDYLVTLSHVQHKMGDRDGAKQSILRALELDPLNVTLKNYLKALH